MGMAASQARYLALTARKTNTEYEGQQINQARTALANQSANLFNQLLNLEVPTAPKTTDYTELQYSYSDGANDSVLDSWQQLSTADPEYNYIVNHYYYTNRFTGAEKLLQNPEVQVEENVVSEYNWVDRAASQLGRYDTPPIVTIDSTTGDVFIDGESTNYTYKEVNTTTPTPTNLTDLTTALSAAGFAPLTDGDYAFQDVNGVWHFMYRNEVDDLGNLIGADHVIQQSVPSYVGNCKLTELVGLTKEQRTELMQILQDCPESEIARYLSIDGDSLRYTGEGIYTFQMNGQTYYTCDEDLAISYNSTAINDNPIENQAKLAYYNTAYIKTKVEEQNHALIETDGKGRFTSIKFDDDSVVYSLNTETITDEAAYQDAMNEYNYKIEKYEKTIADINARTSIIQQEDRTLELRLKQLDTEQKALSTELDAVQKVIKDNVEKTFKTFGD
ncbi:MAG: hypothetical protein MJ237_00140 [bacterium]|nr:hypothetical protein [bacterium]